MKMMSIKMAILVAGMGVLGYLYLKNNPKMLNKMKDIGKDMSRQMYNKLDSEV